MKSFIPWLGGKSQLRKAIIEAFPKEQPGMYVEVFGGAGWVLFGRDKHAPVEVLNDLDGDLVNLYRCVQHHCEELQRELRLGGQQILPNSHEMFYDYKAQLSTRGLTDIQRAARYYYIIKASYGAVRSYFSCTKRPLDSGIDYLAEIQQRLSQVVIENRDFEAIRKVYNKPHTLFYLDPPYFKAENYYQGFTPGDHERLRNALLGIKGRFVLSYNDAPEIRALYEGYNVRSVERGNSLANKTGGSGKVYKELIITNY